MAYPADFGDARRRHWEDAELLFGSERLANADHLYGLSAECAVKQIMRVEGMPVDPAGTPAEEEHRQHLPKIWPIFLSFLGDRRGARYLRRLPQGDPFADWSVHDRYAHRSCSSCLAAVRRHREAARAIVAVAAEVGA